MSSINILKLFYAKLCIVSLGIKEVVKISVVDDWWPTLTRAGRAVHNLNWFFKVLHKSVCKNSKIEKK